MENNIQEDKREKKNKVNKDFKPIVLKLEDLLKLDDASKCSLIDDTLKTIYGIDNTISKQDILKILSLMLGKTSEEVLLPDSLRVKRDDKNLTFYVKKKKGIALWLYIFFGMLIFGTIAGAYGAFILSGRSDLNKDIDKDGIPDLNLDYNGDFIPDINVDTDKDNKPNINIDYKGNRKAIFSIDINGDGIPDFNLVTDASKDPKACTVNCDINGDGWPDINIDTDGDGKADLDIDTDKDGKPDLNLDTDGDTYCDAMCDTDNDGLCDKACVLLDDGKESGPSTKTEPSDYEPSGLLQINFLQGDSVEVKNLYPDDQTSIGTPNNGTTQIPNKVVKVENVSNYAMMYDLELVVNSNTFTSTNLKYKVTSTNGGGSFDWQTVPLTNTVLFQRVIIAARSTQTYTIDFKLQGINANQNYDQGKEFIGYFSIKTI